MYNKWLSLLEEDYQTGKLTHLEYDRELYHLNKAYGMSLSFHEDNLKDDLEETTSEFR